MAKMTEEQAKEKRRASFRNWYELNKEKVSAKRKEKYLSDPEYRAKLIEHSKLHQQLHPRESKKKDRMTIDQLCEKADMSVHTFRKYQNEGYIPVFHGVRPTFTSIHVAVLSEFNSVIRESRYLRGSGVREATLAPYLEKLKGVFSNTDPIETKEEFLQSITE